MTIRFAAMFAAEKEERNNMDDGAPQPATRDARRDAHSERRAAATENHKK